MNIKKAQDLLKFTQNKDLANFSKLQEINDQLEASIALQKELIDEMKKDLDIKLIVE